MSVRLGGDYSFARPSVATLKSLGITFVARYLSDFPSKNLTLGEAQMLSAGGIDIVSNWENSANDSTGGYSAGHRNALEAARQHTACGGPDGRPIYFSIDTDISPSDSNLHAYFKGACDAIGVGRVDCYGSTGVIRALRGAGLIRPYPSGWRTMSTGWNGGAGSPSEFAVEQTGYFNSSIDRDASLVDDFGQWRVGGTPTPTPTPTPGVEVISTQDIAAIALAVNAYHGNNGNTGQPGDQPDVHQTWLTTRDQVNALTAKVDALTAKVDAIVAKLGV